MATDAFSGLRSKFAPSKRGDARLDSLEDEARKTVVISLTNDEKFVQDALKETKTEDVPRIRTMVKATVRPIHLLDLTPSPSVSSPINILFISD
jgi:hypothetical protein